MDFEEKVISSKPVYKGPIAQVEEQQVKLPNGKLASREIIHQFLKIHLDLLVIYF